MGEDWLLLLNTTDAIEADIILTMLLSNELNAVKLNQQDSAYVSIGSINIYVHRDDHVKALYLLENPSDEGSDS